MATCIWEDCSKVGDHARGYCKQHYQRWRRTQKLPLVRTLTRKPLAERIWSHIEIALVSNNAFTEPCWLWTAETRFGYGMIREVELGPWTIIHRWMYETFKGPIPEGLSIDHLCHNIDRSCRGGNTCPHRRCCNPEHLEAVPISINVTRMGGRKTHCRNGHELIDRNRVSRPNRARGECRICHSQQENARYHRSRNHV